MYKVLIGFIIFSAMLFMFSPIFNQPNLGSDINSETGITKYKNIDEGFFVNMLLGTAVGVVFTLAGAFAAGYLIPNFPSGVFIAAGILMSIFGSLWTSFSKPFNNLVSDPYIAQLYNIFIIVFGIIILFSVIEIFTGKGDID
jgi:predicted membrane protein